MAEEDILEKCPHCGTELSPWQKVLLSVDRAIMCKNCWYRIILESVTPNKDEHQTTDSKEDNMRGKDGSL